MIGKHWAVNIDISYQQTHKGSGWSATMEFFDDGFLNDDPDNGRVSTQGALQSRYFVQDGKRPGLSVLLDTMTADAANHGITLVARADSPLCLTVTGIHDDIEQMEANRLIKTAATEAAARGWAFHNESDPR